MNGSRRVGDAGSRSRDSAQATAWRFASEPVARSADPVTERLEIGLERRHAKKRSHETSAVTVGVATRRDDRAQRSSDETSDEQTEGTNHGNIS